MRLGPVGIQRFILRPALVVWAVLSIPMTAYILLDTIAVKDLPVTASFLAHRRNLESPEWVAYLEVADAVPQGCCICLETDNDNFFFITRYQLYPSRVYRKRGLQSGEVSTQESPDYLVSYMGGSLEVRTVAAQ